MSIKKFRAAVVLGTRPEAIKLSMVIKELRKSEIFEPLVIATAQHRELLDQQLDFFEIKPDYDLDLMIFNQSLFDITRRAVSSLEKIFLKTRPHIVLVQGDTTTTFVTALAAFYLKIYTGHIEAGLRSYDKYQPFPEEINRHLTSVLANIHFAPTAQSKENLIREGVPESAIYVTGNTVIDALFWILKTTKPAIEIDSEQKSRRILVTAHRRENWVAGLANISNAIEHIVNKYDNVEFIVVCHPNPEVKKRFCNKIKNPRVKYLEPLDYISFAHLMNSCYLILTDSGGIQEEAPSLGKPVILTREVTERPEGLESRNVILVGSNKNKIIKTLSLLLDSASEYKKVAKPSDIYGDGKASIRIVKILEKVVRSASFKRSLI